jgi:hypothetical protein
MTKSKSENLPRFRSLDELVKFFDTHDLGEYWTEMSEAHFEADIKRKAHFFALDSELVNKVMEIALAGEPLGQGHIFCSQRQAKDVNKTGLITYPVNGGGVLLKSRIRENLKSGSVRELIAASRGRWL